MKQDIKKGGKIRYKDSEEKVETKSYIEPRETGAAQLSLRLG